ncbi:Uncharacterised protein [Mycobacteroides abscessus subsp. abscessus]|nr:Uncharacterised protein [Mycobacteroides abscessus subsp. abscessus]
MNNGVAMITAFPRIVKGETIYSIITKYHFMMKHEHYISTFRNIYARDYSSFSGIGVDLPHNIKQMYNSTKQFKIKKFIDDWLYDHTALGYYTFFTNSDNRHKVKERMLVSDNAGLVFVSGKSTTGVRDFLYLRVCKECLEEDIINTGVGSWYLLHQLPGVFVCERHKSILVNSTLSRRTKILQIPRLEDCLYDEENFLSLQKREILSQIATLTKEILLNNNYPQWDHQVIKEGFRGLFILSGYGERQTTAYNNLIVPDIKDYYGDEIIQLIYNVHGFSIDSIWRLWSHNKVNQNIQHPLLHILLIHFLYHKTGIDRTEVGIEEFIYLGQSRYNRKSTANVHLVCLNHSCLSFKQAGKCVVNQKRLPEKTIYYVYCSECGFKYRSSHLPLDINECSWDSIIDIGGNLRDKIEKMYFSEGLSPYKIASILKITEYSVKLAVNLVNKTNGSSSSLKFNKEKDRFDWLTQMENNPEKTKSELVKEHYALYKRLYRHDKEWLFSRSYNKIPRKKVIDVVDWKKRDKEIVPMLKDAYFRLMARNPPTRITKNQLIIETRLNWSKRYDQKLPSSIQYIKSVEENNDQFTIRKARMVLEEQKKLPLTEQHKRKIMTHKVGYFNKISTEAKQTIQVMLEDFYNELLF